MAEVRILQGNTNCWIAHRIASDNPGSLIREEWKTKILIARKSKSPG